MLEPAGEVWILGGQSAACVQEVAVAMRTRPTVARRTRPEAPMSWRSCHVLGHGSGRNVREWRRMVDWERSGLGEKGITFLKKRKDKERTFEGILGFGGANHQE
jgi:hypothetical protein